MLVQFGVQSLSFTFLRITHLVDKQHKYLQTTKCFYLAHAWGIHCPWKAYENDRGQ